MPSKRAYMALLIILHAAIVRLIPVLVTGMPFSNDVWPLIRIAQALNNGTSIGALYGDPVYGHHAQWPFSVLMAMLYSNVAGISPLFYYQYVGTCLVGLVLALLAYVLGNRLFGEHAEPALFALALSAYPSFVLYTSAFLKEVYAHLIALAFLIWVLTSSRWGAYFLAPVFTVSLVLGHPLPSIILALVLALHYVDERVQAFRGRKAPERVSWRLAALALVLLVATIAYNAVVVKEWPILLNSVDAMLLITYAVTVYAAYVLLGDGGSSCLFGALATAAIVITVRAITSPLSYSLLLYVAPPLTVFLASTIKSVRRSGDSSLRAVTATPLLLIISTGFLYITTYFTQVLGLLHRLLNYLVYVTAVLMAGMARRSIGKTAAIACACVAITLASVCTASTGLDPLLFYWKYSKVDGELEVYIARFLAGAGIHGDPKYSYFMAGLVNYIPLNALVDTCRWLDRSQDLLLLSSSDLKYGIPVSPVDFVKIGENVFTCGDLVFNAGDIWLFG
ncbi:MAG: hypothetical protein QXE66_02410 [Desulfurococcaceae archaeon]